MDFISFTNDVKRMRGSTMARESTMPMAKPDGARLPEK